MQVELFHALQILLIIIAVMSFTCYIAHSIRFLANRTAEALPRLECKLELAYSRGFTVVESESFHKYQIWRFYIFS